MKAVILRNVVLASMACLIVLTSTNAQFTQQGSKLVGTGAVGGAIQGYSVSLSSDGNTAIVGGYNDNSSAGAAWVWTRSGGVWTQQGSKLVGTGAVGSAFQGNTVSLSSDGNTAIVCGPWDNSQAGAAWVWTRSGGVWTQQGSKLVGTGAAGSAQQGVSVSLSSDGNTAIVGGFTDNSNAGAAWVFKFPAEPTISSIADIPADQGGKVRITWTKSIYDALGSAHQITSYGLWREVPPGGVATSRSPMSLAKKTNSALASTYDFIATIPAIRFDSYAYVANTLTDSTLFGSHRYTYIVSAHTADPTVFYISDPDSGNSVDNIPPATPGNPQTDPLVNGPIRISWNRDRTDPDVGHYTVYRSTQDGFTVGPSTQLVTTMDTTVVDSTTGIGQTYYYRVTTVDIHDNQSIPTAQLGNTALPVEFASLAASPRGSHSVSLSWTTISAVNVYGYEVERRQIGNWEKVGYVAVSGSSSAHEYSFTDKNLANGRYAYRIKQIDSDGSFTYSGAVEVEIGLAPREFTLSQNYPNPFNPTTKIEFTVPENGRATLKIYNMLGQEVATLFDGEAEAGRIQQVKFDASQLPSGVYFYRLTAGRATAFSKMILLK